MRTTLFLAAALVAVLSTPAGAAEDVSTVLEGARLVKDKAGIYSLDDTQAYFLDNEPVVLHDRGGRFTLRGVLKSQFNNKVWHFEPQQACGADGKQMGVMLSGLMLVKEDAKIRLGGFEPKAPPEPGALTRFAETMMKASGIKVPVLAMNTGTEIFVPIASMGPAENGVPCDSARKWLGLQLLPDVN